MTMRPRSVDMLLGSAVVLVGFPLLVGPVAGGVLAARRSDRPEVVSTAAGVVGGLPWAALATLAVLGAVPRSGFHRGLLYLGVNPAPPGVFSTRQGLAVGLVVLATCVGMAATGGALGRVLRGRGMSQAGE